AERAGGDERRDLAERVARHEAGVHIQLLGPGEGRAVDRGLRPAGAVGGALEQVGADLLESELEQIGSPPLDGLPHVRRLAALSWEEQGDLSVASHLYEG